MNRAAGGKPPRRRSGGGEDGTGTPPGVPVLVPLASLVEDLQIYPRHAVDPQHVGALIEALRVGVELPPLVVEAGGNRIVDGIHRNRAFIRVLGEEASVAVVFRTYANEAELLLEAIRLNSAHGRRLDKMDQARAVYLAEQAGASTQALSVVLNITEQKVEQLRVRVAFVEHQEGGMPLFLKRPARHLQGQTLTYEQATAHQSMPGNSLLLTARQIRLALTTGLANAEDPMLRHELARLLPVLRRWLRQNPPPEQAEEAA